MLVGIFLRWVWWLCVGFLDIPNVSLRKKLFRQLKVAFFCAAFPLFYQFFFIVSSVSRVFGSILLLKKFRFPNNLVQFYR